MTPALPIRLRFSHDHSGGLPVWTEDGPLGAHELAAPAVPTALVERLQEWNDRIWPVWDARV